MNSSNYKPAPLDTSQIKLPDSLLDLTEQLARNTHEVWAKQRMDEGWKYGEKRDDKLKEHPGLVPYEMLSETEKEYDRKTAMETLKMIYSLNFTISLNK